MESVTPATATPPGSVTPPAPPETSPVPELPPAVTWFARQVDADDDKPWLPYDETNSAILEEALRINVKSVVLRYGKIQVDLAARKASPIYWKDEAEVKTVVRGAWLCTHSPTHIVPYSELEQLRICRYAQHGDATQKPMHLSDMENDIVYRDKTEKTPAGLYECRTDGKGSLRPVGQVFPRLGKVEDPYDSHRQAPPVHLVLVVHGIGENEWKKTKEYRFLSRITRARRRSEELVVDRLSDQARAGRVEWLPVEWSDVVHNSDMKEMLERATIKGMDGTRDFCNHVLADIMFYTNPHTRALILEAVVKRMNALHQKFCAVNPDFDPTQVTVMGHSLGSIITFDILSHQGKEHDLKTAPQLRFTVQNCFTLGSPVGCFLAVRGSDTASRVKLHDHEFQLHGGCSLYNIFHPFDPVAYRLEPIAHPSFAKVDPVVIPHHKEGGKRLHVAMADAMRSMWSSKEVKRDTDDDGEVAVLEETAAILRTDDSIEPHVLAQRTLGIFNRQRIDYQLQKTAIEAAHPYPFLKASEAHCKYWHSDDCLLFIMDRIGQGMVKRPPAQVRMRKRISGSVALGSNPFDELLVPATPFDDLVAEEAAQTQTADITTDAAEDSTIPVSAPGGPSTEDDLTVASAATSPKGKSPRTKGRRVSRRRGSGKGRRRKKVSK